MASLLGSIDLGWTGLVPWAAALHAVALPAAVGISVARFRATVPPPVRWVAISAALAAASALLLAASVRLASPRAAATLVELLGPAIGAGAVLLAAAAVVALVERHWAIGLATVALALALVLDSVPLSFMTSPGAWPVSRATADAVWNPTLLPLLLGRLGAVAALCGACVLRCATFGGDAQRPRAVLAGALLSVGGATVGAAAAWLWLRAVGPQPAEALLGDAAGVTRAATVAGWTVPAFAAAALLVAWLSTTRFVTLRRRALALLLLLAGAGAGAAELARVGLSGPWSLGAPGNGWLYANGLTREETATALRSGLAAVRPAIGPAGPKGDPDRGERIRALACAPCHSARALGARLDGWPRAAIAAAVVRLDRLWPASPPFPGDARDARDLALCLARLDGREEGAAVAPPDPHLVEQGRRRFADLCVRCHQEIRLEPRVAGWNEPLAARAVGRLQRMNPAMPRLEPSEADRRALAAYVATLGSGAGAARSPSAP